MSSKLSALPPINTPFFTDEMYIITNTLASPISFSITNDNLFSIITRNIQDKALRFETPSVTPSISAPGTGAIAFLAPGQFAISENGGPYVNLLSGLGRARLPNTTIIPNVGGVETEFHQNIFPPNTFPNDGDFVRITSNGTVANNNTAKLLRHNFPGFGIDMPPEAVYNSGGFGNQWSWEAVTKIVRVSSTDGLVTISMNFAAIAVSGGAIQTIGSFQGAVIQPFTPFDWTTDIMGYNITATAPNDGDLTQDLSIAELFLF
jgi:hypothetical protein